MEIEVNSINVKFQFCRNAKGVSWTDLWLDTSTKGLKRVYTSLYPFLEVTHFIENMCLSIIYNFYILSISLKGI
jgi:hypothetical protein